MYVYFYSYQILNSSSQAVEYVVYALENLSSYNLPYTATEDSAGLIIATFSTRVGSGGDEWAEWSGRIYDSDGNTIWKQSWSNNKTLTATVGTAIKKNVTYNVSLTKTACGVGDGSGAGSGQIATRQIQVGKIKTD